MNRLTSQKIHPHFAGYLCLRFTAAADNRTTDLSPSFKDFFDDFLKVRDAHPKWPYLRPFWHQQSSSRKIWFNKNVAGSYAPGSIHGKALRSVISWSGSRQHATYSLKKGHHRLAHKYLAYEHLVPAVPLAAVLYRDYRIEGDGGPPSPSDLVAVFREEFGYNSSEALGNYEFEHLYDDDSAHWSADQLFGD